MPTKPTTQVGVVVVNPSGIGSQCPEQVVDGVTLSVQLPGWPSQLVLCEAVNTLDPPMQLAHPDNGPPATSCAAVKVNPLSHHSPGLLVQRGAT